ncbi:hypothetical protein GCM10027194_12180 [Thalassiella azotivora]
MKAGHIGIYATRKPDVRAPHALGEAEQSSPGHAGNPVQCRTAPALHHQGWGARCVRRADGPALFGVLGLGGLNRNPGPRGGGVGAAQRYVRQGCPG